MSDDLLRAKGLMAEAADRVERALALLLENGQDEWAKDVANSERDLRTLADRQPAALSE